MKLIIEIPEEEYNHIKRTNEYSIAHTGYIYDGTPIPDNATNGDVIKAIFPNNDTVKVMEIRMKGDWWNAPYQKGDKNDI